MTCSINMLRILCINCISMCRNYNLSSIYFFVSTIISKIFYLCLILLSVACIRFWHLNKINSLQGCAKIKTAMVVTACVRVRTVAFPRKRALTLSAVACMVGGKTSRVVQCPVWIWTNPKSQTNAFVLLVQLLQKGMI